jgi:methylamine---glutamate N-methyltransferase subunit C
MAVYQCKVCGFKYDDIKEGIKWSELHDDWLCPLCSSGKSYFSTVEIYECSVCAFCYDEEKEEIQWNKLDKNWICPICSSGKNYFNKKNKCDAVDETISKSASEQYVEKKYLSEWERSSDDIENYMDDIHKISVSGKYIVEPMKSKKRCPGWDDILFKGSQLFNMPLNEDEQVLTKTIIGTKASVPLTLNAPIIISHMSYGALSKEAKIALAKGSASVQTAMCSGEGGILNESLDNSYKYIFEYVPNKYSVTDEYLKRVDAVEIKIGQSAKPGMGGHLPSSKVTEDIAIVRGKQHGKDIISPAKFAEINNREDLKDTVTKLRELTGGKPIGIKLAAGNIEQDLEIAVFASPDFITLDGRAGATGAAPKFIKDSTSVPTLFALYRAKKFLKKNAPDISLIITGGLRISSDFAKALAMGADAVAIATAAMMSIGCQQYRICNTGKCPVGIATQDIELRKRLDISKSSERLNNFLSVSIKELKSFARLTGNKDIHNLSIDNLCTVNSEISEYTDIDHV